MKLTNTLSAIALALLTFNAFASDDEHEEGEELYQAQCASCHGATGGMDMSKRLAPPIAGVRMHYISAHPDKDEFVAAVSGWLASQDEAKSLMPGAIRQFKLMPPLEIAIEDAEKIAAYIYAGDIDKPEGFDKHVEEMHGKQGMGQGMHGKGKYGMGQGKGHCMHGKSHGKGYDKGQCMHGMGMHSKGMHGKGHQMHGKSMNGMAMPGMSAMNRGPGMSPEDMKARMMQHFNLSADQMGKMQALMKDKSSIMQSLSQQQQAIENKFEELDTGSASYKSDIFSLAEEQSMLARRMMVEKGEMRFKLDSLLSPDQRQRFAQMKARKSQMKQRMGQRMGMPNMGMPSNGMPPMPQMNMPQMTMPPIMMPQTGLAPYAMPQIGKPPASAPTKAAPTAPVAPTAEPTTEEAPAEAVTTETAPKGE